ncbi:MAG: citrate synthase family protein [Myxococcales bacterium]|nr:citrate synthase family protein [Myxococcales bacterium]
MNQQQESQSAYLSAPEAARFLRVKPATLYAYVSRGLLDSVPSESGRARRYRLADLERLKGRRRGEEGSLLRGAEPVLDSSITDLTASGPVYRGHAATGLAEQGTPFESVAELLWTGELPGEPPVWPEGDTALERVQVRLPEEASPLARQQLAVAALAPLDPGRFDLRPEAVRVRARRVIRTVAAALALGQRDKTRLRAALAAPTVAEAVALALGGKRQRRHLRAIDQLLVLLADHELNASTFAARVAASAEADPWAVVLAGIATLSGPRHGAASDRVEALVSEVESARDAAAVVHDRERRGERVPGFGHPLYPQGDPRARILVESARSLGARSHPERSVLALLDEMAAGGRPAPNVDIAAVALRVALGLPRGATTGLFAVARCAGWMAHALEQYEAGFLLRPRARYRGRSVASRGS